MISSASFVSGSARGSNGSGGVDNSATMEKINQSEAIKTNSEVERQKILPIRFHALQLLQLALLLLERRGCLFHFSS
jgi:hypothetical protein